MSTQVERLSQILRERILAGQFKGGDKLPEVAVAEALGVSRTPARLALAALEQEGLVVREPNRGYRVRGFTIDEIVDAVKVRGELEAMAARLAAERGIGQATAEALRQTMRQADAILSAPRLDVADRVAWTESNVAFHRIIIDACGNRALGATFEHVCRTPLASPRAIVFDQTMLDFGRNQIRRAQEDHTRILAAIEQRAGARAEAIMREHAFMSAENKRRNLLALETRSIDRVPGLALIDLRNAG